MESVVLASRTGIRLELAPTEHPHPEVHDGLPAWQARLTGAGLDATHIAPEAGWEQQSLADYLSALDADWRGWDGERTWQSMEQELHLAATHDKRNTVVVRVTMEDGAPPRWRCESELELDPGAFRAAATAARKAS
jgi:Family of unknown function (DUF6228)